tara:strand:+ start:1939 stop:2823 length:885 start_codon:yes stop_codon:yes gene_type:complete
MTAVLKVKDDGAWRTVVEPYVNVDGTWKTVHNISVKHGDTWRLAHKTAIDRYSLIADNSLLNMTGSGSYTVATGVRYLQVSLSGGAGQGGGSVRSGGNGLAGGHYTCGSSVQTPTTTDYGYGGLGGNAGNVNVKFEVIPGETYTWSGGKGGYVGGGNATPMELPYNSGQGSISSVGTTKSGGAGHAGTALTFTGTSGTLSAGGGLGGTPGQVTVSANCSVESFGVTLYGYNVSASSPSQAGTSSNSISATNLVQTITNGTASSGGGAGSGNVDPSGASGSNGSDGTISIWQYGS